MKIIVIPLILTLTPALILFLFLKYFVKGGTLSKFSKVIIGVISSIASLALSIYATMISINGFAENGTKCATGAVSFLYLGLILSFGVIPMLLKK